MRQQYWPKLNPFDDYLRPDVSAVTLQYLATLRASQQVGAYRSVYAAGAILNRVGLTLPRSFRVGAPTS